MLIWTLAIVLFGCLGFVGFNIGVIRVTFSFIGLLVASALAWPLGHFMYSIVGFTGVKSPVYQWLLGPVVVFAIILTAFKIAGYSVNRQVDVYYKYKAGDLRMGLWNRLNHRLGLCMGLANAAVYLVLVSMVIYVLSYGTYQLVDGDTAKWYVNYLNKAGKQLQDTGMAKTAVAIDPMPDTYYKAADLAGLIYHNDLLEARLTRYPAFLAIGEKPEFQEIGADKAFTELRQKQPPIMEILDHQKIQAVINNPDLLKEIWGIVVPDMDDFLTFLKTGQSPKYDAIKVLGRWDFDVAAALNLMKRTQTNITVRQMRTVKAIMQAAFSKTTLTATPDNQIIVKNLGKPRTPPPGVKPTMAAVPQPAAGGRQRGGRQRGGPTAPVPTPGVPTEVAPQVDFTSPHGTWSGEGDKFQITLEGLGTMDVKIEGDKMVIAGGAYPFIFDQEY